MLVIILPSALLMYRWQHPRTGQSVEADKRPLNMWRRPHACVVKDKESVIMSLSGLQSWTCRCKPSFGAAHVNRSVSNMFTPNKKQNKDLRSMATLALLYLFSCSFCSLHAYHENRMLY